MKEISVEDSNRYGRLHISATKANIAVVKSVIEEDAWYAVREIAAYVEITSAATHKILTEHSGLWKIRALWVPNFFSDLKKVFFFG